MLEEDDEDTEENSCIPRGTLQISAPWISLSIYPSLCVEGDTREDSTETEIESTPTLYCFQKKKKRKITSLPLGAPLKGTTGCCLSASNTAGELEGVTAKVE